MASEIKVDTISEKTSGNGIAIDSVVHKDSAVYPSSADGGALGSASNEWSDLFLADSSVIKFGADQDTTLTHTDGTGLTLNSTNKLCFNDASQFVQGSSATVLSIGATDEIDLTATAIDINGTCDISGTFSLAGTNMTATATELNLLDGGTSVGSSITIADADGFVVNDGGSMKTIPASDIKTYNPGGTAWQAVVTGATTMVSGRGYFVNTTSSAFTMTLPASPSIGDNVSVIDYAGTFDSNTCTIGRNSEKIQGASADMTVTTERAAFTLVYVDATHGWLLTNK